MKRITNLQQLRAAGFISTDLESTLQPVVDRFALSITSEIESILHLEPLQKQFVPTEQELVWNSGDREDPISDNAYQTVKGIIHRYPDRCLLLPITACPVYCRFCFRREKVGQKNRALSKVELSVAYQYISDHPEIWEVILSGGDPLILKPRVIKSIFENLNKIQTVEVLRLHTRVPVVLPDSINTSLIASLKSTSKAVYVAIHANHASEFTPAAVMACARLVDAGIPLLSQTVLLKGINDTPEAMGALMRTFVKNRIKPYYLHHADLAIGTEHFRTTIEDGQAIMKALRGKYSGLCQPTYVLDIPGGFGKVPISASYLSSHLNDKGECDGYCVQDYQGQQHRYPPV